MSSEDGKPTLGLDISVLAGPLAVVRLEPAATLPEWTRDPGPFLSITRTDEELSVVCPEERVPPSVPNSGGWACLKVAGPLDLAAVGILAALADSLRDAAISIFAISTYDTDYLLVPRRDLDRAVQALELAGHRITGPDLPEGRARGGKPDQIRP